MRLRSLLLLCLVTLAFPGCGKKSSQASAAVSPAAAIDERLYGHWQFSGVTDKSDQPPKTHTVGGDIELGKDGQCRGVRIIGRVYGPQDGAFTVKGNHLHLAAENIDYTWSVTEGALREKAVYILTLENGTLNYQLVRAR